MDSSQKLSEKLNLRCQNVSKVSENIGPRFESHWLIQNTIFNIRALLVVIDKRVSEIPVDIFLTKRQKKPDCR